ncbi:hypothetical protein D3C81_1709630 [compost metagenome]
MATLNHAFRADRALEEVIEDALQSRRHLDHHGALLLQIQIAHGIDHVGVRGGHQRLGVEPVLPDRQHVVAGAERVLRAFLHGVHVQCRQCPDVGLHGALKQQLVLELSHAFQGWITAGEGQVGQLFIAGGGLGGDAGRDAKGQRDECLPYGVHG